MIKGCIFDLDGTLADTVESIAHAINQALNREGFVGRPVEEYNFYAGDGMNTAVERALKAVGDKQLYHLEAAIAAARAIFSEDPLYHVKPYEGIVETLDTLRQRGLKLAVFSNKPHLQAVEVVESIFGKGYFDTIQGQEESVPKKPDPTGAFRIAGGWGVSSEECMYIGDTNTDMETGTAAKMHKIGVTWGFRPQKELEDYGADFIIHTPEELLRVQEELDASISCQKKPQ